MFREAGAAGVFDRGDFDDRGADPQPLARRQVLGPDMRQPGLKFGPRNTKQRGLRLTWGIPTVAKL